MVFRDGQVFLDGTPEDVFSHHAALCGSGLELPKAAEIALLLHQMGVLPDASDYTHEMLLSAILKAAHNVENCSCTEED